MRSQRTYRIEARSKHISAAWGTRGVWWGLSRGKAEGAMMVLAAIKYGRDEDFRLVCEQTKIVLREIMACNSPTVSHGGGK